MTDHDATGGARRFRFGAVAPLTADLPAWKDQVRRIADSGFSTLLMPDVPQWQPAPGPALAVAATLADLRVGTWGSRHGRSWSLSSRFMSPELPPDGCAASCSHRWCVQSSPIDCRACPDSSATREARGVSSPRYKRPAIADGPYR